MKENPNKFAAIAFVVAGCFWWRMREKMLLHRICHPNETKAEVMKRTRFSVMMVQVCEYGQWEMWCNDGNDGDDDDDTTKTCKKIAPRSTLTCRLLNSRDAHSLQFEHNTLHTQTYT